MNRVTHFEIPVSDPEKSIQFYQSIFGWKFNKFGDFDYWLVDTGSGSPGINGGLMKRNDPRQPLTNSIEVANIDQSIQAIEKAGGIIVVPKRAIPGVGWLAYFTDPDGIIQGIMQNDTNAN